MDVQPATVEGTLLAQVKSILARKGYRPQRGDIGPYYKERISTTFYRVTAATVEKVGMPYQGRQSHMDFIRENAQLGDAIPRL